MSERKKQNAFLKALLQRVSSERQHQLQDRIAQAERDEKSVRMAMHMVGVLGLVCVCGLCYEAIFVADFFANPTHVLTRVFGYLCGASAIGWLIFLAQWLWCRALTNRLYADCRRLLMSSAEVQPGILSSSECPTALRVRVLNQDTDYPRQTDSGPTAAAA